MAKLSDPLACSDRTFPESSTLFPAYLAFAVRPPRFSSLLSSSTVSLNSTGPSASSAFDAVVAATEDFSVTAMVAAVAAGLDLPFGDVEALGLHPATLTVRTTSPNGVVGRMEQPHLEWTRRRNRRIG